MKLLVRHESNTAGWQNRRDSSIRTATDIKTLHFLYTYVTHRCFLSIGIQIGDKQHALV